MLCKPLTLLPSFLTQVDDSTDVMKMYDQTVQSILDQKPNTIVVIQTDMGVHADGMNFVIPEDGIYCVGDVTFAADLELGRQMQMSLEQHDRKSNLIHETQLLTSLEVFLLKIQKNCPEMPTVLVVGSSLQSAEEHYKLGSLIRRAIDADTNSVAIVALGHLSSQLEEGSVFGYSRFGKEYNEEYLKYFTEGKLENFLYIDPFLLDEVAETLYKPSAMLLGLLGSLDNKVKVDVKEFEEEGVGYVVGSVGGERKD